VLTLAHDAAGVFAHQHLEEAVSDGIVQSDSPIPPSYIQPASIDLRLGEVAYSVRCSFLPGHDSVEGKLTHSELKNDEFDLTGDGAVLDVNRPYLIPLQERLRLPNAVRAKANPKSSTGRADVFTRVITDYGDRFDEIAAGYEGPLYLEVVPLSFPIRVCQGLSLNQLRLVVGKTALSDDEIRDWHATRDPLLFMDGKPAQVEQLVLSGGLFLGLDLHGDSKRRVGYRARQNAPKLNMSFHKHRPNRYWESVECERGSQIVLDSQRFYLLMSSEAVSIPPGLASEMTAYDPTSGELRTHYAGFFDPGFGYDAAGESIGSRAALEVRAHDVPFMIEQGQRVCKLTFDRMLAEPDQLYGEGINSNYQRQEETLSKHFLKKRKLKTELKLPEDNPQAQLQLDS
jgi:dCTP deaminase